MYDIFLGIFTTQYCFQVFNGMNFYDRIIVPRKTPAQQASVGKINVRIDCLFLQIVTVAAIVM